MNFIDPSDFQNLTTDLLAMIKLFTGNVAICLKLCTAFQYFDEITGFPLNDFCINHEKMALTKFVNMSIKSLLAPFVNGLLRPDSKKKLQSETFFLFYHPPTARKRLE